MTERSTLFIDEGQGLIPVVVIRSGHIDDVDAIRAIARGALRAEIRRDDYLQFAIFRVAPTSTQYAYKTSVAGPVFGPLAELPEIIATLEARSDRGY